MGDIATKGNRLTKRKGPHGYASQPHLSVHAKGGRAGKFGGGRTNLLEQLGRVEAEPSNRNRRAEISRVHGELNRGYAKGGRAGFEHGGQAETKALGGFRKVSKNQKKFKKGMCKPSWITKKKKQYITRKSAKPKGSGVEDTSGKTLWITKKEKPKYITKKEKPELKTSQGQAGLKQRAVDPTIGYEQRTKNAGGGRATHGYGRAYMKGGRAR